MPDGGTWQPEHGGRWHRERGQRLYDQVKDLPFHCETCQGFHPLREHRDCRAAAWKAIAARARQAITGSNHD